MTPAVGAHPQYLKVGSFPAKQPPPGTVLFPCQDNSQSNPPATVVCYGPDQIRAAYGVRQLQNQGINGRGRTIVIIDAFGSPTIASDLATFNAAWGLPSSTLNVIAPYGVASTDPDNALGWAIETSLDVQWAHVIAPKATIDLVVARSDSDPDILKATKYAISNNLGDVISQSYGESESCVDPGILNSQHALFDQATAKGTSIFASSGDEGAAGFSCDGNSFIKDVSNPASDPDVTAVGGTSLTADAVTGAYESETTWNETIAFLSQGDGPTASGGGFSSIYKRPSYQASAISDPRYRGLPDIAYNAGINGGVLVFITDPADSTLVDVYVVGGTSAGSPQWAALAALADQEAGSRLGSINGPLYQLGTGHSASKYFHDITTGNNSIPRLKGFPGTPVSGYKAGPGWDAATGLGTPRADNLVPALAQAGS